MDAALTGLLKALCVVARYPCEIKVKTLKSSTEISNDNKIERATDDLTDP
jgi:hypothetical protein